MIICARSQTSDKKNDSQSYANFSEVYDERREILFYLKTQVPEKFIDKIRQSDKKLALRVLTDTSNSEKILFFDILKKFRYANYDTVIEILQKSFPTLANYLSDSEKFFSAEQQEYFRHYRWLKITNDLNEDFYDFVCEIAENNGQNIYSMKSRNQIVEEEYSEWASILFVDAMGAEYLNFLSKIFSVSEFQNFSIKYQVGYCNLPSITQRNKDFLIGKNIAAEIIELDKLKHSNKNYPENILAELNFLSGLKEKVLSALQNYRKIIICADHGASRLAVLARKTKFDKTFEGKGREIFDNGRFANILNDKEEKFANAIEQDDKIIFADYSRFVQQGGTGNEVHGGATLEEWLVPVVTIERKEKILPKKPTKSNSISNKKRGIMENKNFDI